MTRASGPPATGPRAPATRDQADAYRFGLRRLEAALVRGDPVLRHEGLRSQRRAALAGVLLALLGLCGVAVYALLVPAPEWRRQAVVLGSGSGAMYVVAHGPDRLVPVANLPAARLVLAALRRAGATDTEPAEAIAVPDPTLDGAPRTPTAAVPGAVAVPAGGAAVAPRWAVCDRTTGDGALAGTSVIGAAAVPPASAGDGVLVEDPDRVTWLVTAGHRHRVDTGDGRLLAALGLTRALPRVAAPALVSLLPEGPRLATPEVPGRGRPAPRGLPGLVGDVLVARPVGGAGLRHFVVLAGGLQEVPELVAELLRVASGAREPRSVGLDVLARAVLVDDLTVAGWPAGPPRLRNATEAPVLCWTWAADGPPTGDMWLGSALPLPAGSTPVALAQADGPGPRVDEVAVGAGGAVRAAGPVRGPLWLVSATGVGYPVADDETAAALGLTVAEPAPEGVLRLLPTGPALDVAAAGRVLGVAGAS